MNNDRLYFIFGVTTGIAIASVSLFLMSAARSDEHKVSRSSSPRRSRGSLGEDTLSKLESLLSVPTLKLNEIVKHFLIQMARGLAVNDATLRMIPSHVVRRATGQERGLYLALDLGGSNFRVCEVDLEGNGAGI